MSMFTNAHHLKIKNNSFTVNVGTAQQDKLDQFLQTAALNAILNAGGRADEVRCYPGTREEIIRKTERWMEGHGETDHRMLWLSGPAGAGKSAISQTVAERRRSRVLPAANFFFFRGDHTRNSPLPLVATLVYQLVDFYPALREQLSDCLTAKPLTHKASVGEQFARLLANPIESVQNSSTINNQIILIIDGLDECNDEAAQIQILTALYALVSSDGSPFRVMVASRTEPHLAMFFNTIAGSVESIYLNDDYQPEDDIRKFVSAKFDDIKRTHHLAHTLKTDWPTQEDIDKITSKSSGQFIYGATVMRFIEHSKDSPALSLLTVHQIRPPTSHSPFAQLDALYSHVFSKARDMRAIKWTIGLDQIGLSATGCKILCMAGCDRLELESLLADISAIARISIIEEEDQCCLYTNFYHASLPDYLNDKSRAGIYHLDQKDVFAEVSAVCLRKSRDAGGPFNPFYFTLEVDVAAKVNKPTTNLLHLSKQQIKWHQTLDSINWEALVDRVIGHYFTTDKALFKHMLKTWLRIASIHKIDTSQVKHVEPKAAYRYYELYRVIEIGKSALGRGLIQ